MSQKKFLICCTLLLLAKEINCWFESCNYSYDIDASSVYLLKSGNYPNRYESGSSCKWYLSAPTGYFIELKCTYNLDDTSYDCASQRFYVSRDGDKELNYSEFFCGTSSITRYSVGNEISLGYTSSYNKNGIFYCEAKAIKTTQNNCQCGWSKTARIVGGSVAQPNEFVSMAALVDVTRKSDPEGPIFSGAAIISERYAMTAAHSFNSKPDISVIYLLVGDHDTSLGTDTPYAALYQAMSVIRHELYVPDSNDQSNDIALIQTVEAIKWKRTIGPACLPFIYEGYNDYFNGYAIVAAGFGATEFAGPSSNVLKKVSLTVVSNDECNNTYGNINSGQICTFTKNADTCQRDSGGSLYWTYNNRQYTVGIVSYGTACASNSPSVNTRVTYYLKWIQDQLPGVLLCNI